MIFFANNQKGELMKKDCTKQDFANWLNEKPRSMLDKRSQY